ncbi:response regulator transcription factor [Nocardia uniformis]|uniref:Response regulator transcription factor n=1 Tax=Nocardia uniformis TaxID=53432 RepID=A0A849BVP8_9NOCA|nr:response regulator transcription factor [Nocardia uniformis]NNH70632.1 response regulator transcription factor [Nocardia uniformis]
MPGADRIAATWHVTTSGLDTRMVMPTTVDLDEYTYTAYMYIAPRGGSDRFLFEGASAQTLGDAVRTVVRDDALSPPRPPATAGGFARHADRRAIGGPVANLTRREDDVLVLIACEYSGAETARALAISEQAATIRIDRGLDKLRLRDRTGRPSSRMRRG